MLGGLDSGAFGRLCRDRGAAGYGLTERGRPGEIGSRRGGEALLIDSVLDKVDRYVQLLKELDLTYVVRDEVLLITTPEEAESQLVTKVYPVGDLVNRGPKSLAALRLLKRIEAGRGAYPLEEGLDDMLVDYHLEKLGFYVANPLTSQRSALGRAALKLLTRRGG